MVTTGTAGVAPGRRKHRTEKTSFVVSGAGDAVVDQRHQITGGKVFQPVAMTAPAGGMSAATRSTGSSGSAAASIGRAGAAAGMAAVVGANNVLNLKVKKKQNTK